MSFSGGRSIPFTKATACGNDFILIESKHFNGDTAEFTRQICDRHYGVGADGVEWLSDSPKGDVVAHLINSDGSYAEISGNGTRCVAAYTAVERSLDRIVVETGAGLKVCTLTSRVGNEFRFRTDMGKPVVQQPFNVQLKSGDVRGVPVSTGNPHFVTFVDQFPADWQGIAAEIQALSELFPDGTNVEFVRVVDDGHIEIRIFERGAGETLSSGTGSSASAAAAIATGRTRRIVLVAAPGGEQTVIWEEELQLEGPATIICRGEFYY